MTQDEILSAAKEAGCNDEFIKMAPFWLEAFAKSIQRIVERKTIERCAAECDDRYHQTYIRANRDCAAAIRKLGEE